MQVKRLCFITAKPVIRLWYYRASMNAGILYL